MKKKPAKRNPVAKALRVHRPKVKPSGKFVKRVSVADIFNNPRNWM